MYKVGDKVLFTFLGQKKKGIIISKVNNIKCKIKSDDGSTYPSIYTKETQSKKKSDKPLGLILDKLKD